MYLFYVDDSTGSGHELLTAVAVDARLWSVALDRWLEFRRGLATDWGLPKLYELHAGKFISGRGWPNEADSAAVINHDLGLRQTIYQQALDVIAAAPDLDVHTVHRSARRPNSQSVYRGLLTHLEEWLVTHDEHGLIAMDGEDRLYPRIHRDLPLESRRIVEDAWLQESHSNQFIQVADLVVHAAFQGAVRQPSREFMWDWHSQRFPDPVILT